MRTLFLLVTSLIICSVLTSCSTPQPKDLDGLACRKPLPLSVRLSGSNLILNLTLGKDLNTDANFFDQVDNYGYRHRTSSQYTLIDAKNNAVVGHAESAILSDDVQEGVFRGTRTVETSPDGAKILINEDISDASPAARYILFERQPTGNYETFYLAAPRIPINPDFPNELPS